MNEGKRLAELLNLVFESQAAAGKALGASQPTINRLISRDVLSDFIIEKYSPALKMAGLNPDYIRDETAPMTIDPEAEEIEAIGLEIEQLRTRAEQVDVRLNAIMRTKALSPYLLISHRKLEELQTRAAQVDAQLQGLQLKTR